MSRLSQLPDAEFQIMQIIWNNPVPLTSAKVESLLKETKAWHLSTVQTLLRRLVARNFLSPEKKGKEILYTPLVMHDEYLRVETEVFREKFHKQSLSSLIRALYADKKPSDEDIAEIEQWFKSEEE